jgi:DNA-binding LacI/PurR family transcriptional regulator
VSDDAHPAERRRAPSMADVAELAGVSHQTVSRVLNDHPNVRPETRDRVRDAITRLGYRRNSAARALVTRRSATIGVLTTSSALYGPTSTVVALEGAARERGYFVSLASVHTFEHERLLDTLDHFMVQGVDGIVVVAPQDDVAAAVEGLSTDVPVVMIAALDEDHRRAGTVAVAVDQRLGGRLVTEHLLDLGHRDVLHLAGPADWFDARERERGWSAALRDRGVEPGRVVRCDWSAQDGYDAGRRIADELAAGGGPTAVFAANDQLALGVLRALWERGVRVPQDVSVAGFDDIAGASFFVPSLTTVNQPFAEVGRQALSALADAIGGASVGARLIEPTLVVRGSTGTPRPCPPAPHRAPSTRTHPAAHPRRAHPAARTRRARMGARMGARSGAFSGVLDAPTPASTRPAASTACTDGYMDGCTLGCVQRRAGCTHACIHPRTQPPSTRAPRVRAPARMPTPAARRVAAMSAPARGVSRRLTAIGLLALTWPGRARPRRGPGVSARRRTVEEDHPWRTTLTPVPPPTPHPRPTRPTPVQPSRHWAARTPRPRPRPTCAPRCSTAAPLSASSSARPASRRASSARTPPSSRPAATRGRTGWSTAAGRTRSTTCGPASRRASRTSWPTSSVATASA